MNLLTKGSLNHLTYQLKKKPKQHFADVAEVISLSNKKGLQCNIYLEDWSNGMRHSKEYVLEYLDFLKDQPVRRVMLPDTLGVLIPSETYSYVSELVSRYPDVHFDFHAHNDYDLSLANVLEATKAGA
jgi:D-citramalate synthase